MISWTRRPRVTGDAAESLEVMYPYQRLLAQLCHAPLVLAAAKTLSGRRTAAYPAIEPDVVAAGAGFVDSSAFVDGQMVSARPWPDHPTWMASSSRSCGLRPPADPS